MNAEEDVILSEDDMLPGDVQIDLDGIARTAHATTLLHGARTLRTLGFVGYIFFLSLYPTKRVIYQTLMEFPFSTNIYVSFLRVSPQELFSQSCPTKTSIV